MPYGDMSGGGPGSTTSLDEIHGNFNQAPGGYVQPRRGRRSYSDYDYDDRVSVLNNTMYYGKLSVKLLSVCYMYTY